MQCKNMDEMHCSHLIVSNFNKKLGIRDIKNCIIQISSRTSGTCQREDSRQTFLLFCSPACISRGDGDDRGCSQRQGGGTGDRLTVFAVPIMLLRLSKDQRGQLQISTGTSAYLEKLHVWSGSLFCICFRGLGRPIAHLAQHKHKISVY